MLRNTQLALRALTQVPGAVTLPFLSNVHSVMAIFLAGQHTGDAIAANLFGDHIPSAKSPVTFPVSESDMTEPCSVGTSCDYTEGRFVGYRALEDVSVNFAFGHGLSYTNFTYSWIREPALKSDNVIVMEISVTCDSEDAVSARI